MVNNKKRTLKNRNSVFTFSQLDPSNLHQFISLSLPKIPSLWLRRVRQRLKVIENMQSSDFWYYLSSWRTNGTKWKLLVTKKYKEKTQHTLETISFQLLFMSFGKLVFSLFCALTQLDERD